ncbi:MAG: alpha/beta hydrolase [Pseudomonadota bacterium]
MNLYPLRLIIVIVLLMVRSASQASTVIDAASAGLDGVEKECIVEPVFDGSACIYQANVDAEKTIVLVHGLNGRALGDWKNQIPLLAKKYHVLAFDLPGFGDSGKDVAYYSPTEYTRFIRYVTERYAHGNITLVGHSMGGAIALRYVATYPQTVEKLVLVDVAGVLHRMAYARQLANGWVKSNATNDSRVLSFADKIANKLLSKMEPIAGPITEMMAQQLLKRELLNVDSSVISSMTLANEDLSDALLKMELPALVVWGEDDLVAPIRTAKVLLEYIPEARFEVIAGAAHVPMVEQPEKFNRVLLDYINGVKGSVDVVPVDDGVDSAPRTEVCRKESGKLYQGHYDSLTLISCSRVVIKNATINELIIRSSRASIENSEIVSDKIALSITGSDVLITATRLSGDIAIDTSRSRLDLAAVKLIGKSNSVRGAKSSSLVFSVSEISSPLATRSVHEFLKVDRRHPL